MSATFAGLMIMIKGKLTKRQPGSKFVTFLRFQCSKPSGRGGCLANSCSYRSNLCTK